MRPRGEARAADHADLLAALDALTGTDLGAAEVGVEGLEAEAVVNNDDSAVAGIALGAASGDTHNAVAGGIDGSALTGGEVDAGMEAVVAQDGMETVAEAADDLAAVLGDRHDGRHGRHALVLVAGDAVDLVERLGLDIEALGEVVDLLGGALEQLAVVEVVEFGITLDTADAAVPLALGHGSDAEDGPVESVVALLEVAEDLLGAVDTLVEAGKLPLVAVDLTVEQALVGRLHKLQAHNHYDDAQHHAEEDVEADAAHALLERDEDLLIAERVGIEPVGMALFIQSETFRVFP